MNSDGVRGRWWSTRTLAGSTRTLAVTILLVTGVSGIARADVPAEGDIVSCNEEARQQARDRATTPTGKDEAAAEAARTAGTAVGDSRSSTAAMTLSSDPQIHGMDGEGAKDAAYRAVYRVCMRRKGF
jgi:hypothetical protein